MMADPQLSELIAQLDQVDFAPTKSEQIRIDALLSENTFATMQPSCPPASLPVRSQEYRYQGLFGMSTGCTLVLAFRP